MLEIRSSRILQRLRWMSTETVGASLLILVRNDNEVYELNLIGEDAHLSDFCRLLRESPEGLARCMTCRSLVTLGACYRGLSQYTCHGGISVLAAPAPFRSGLSSALSRASVILRTFS